MSIKTKLTQEEIDQYYELISQDYSQRQACTILGISRGIIQCYLKRVATQENEKLIDEFNDSVQETTGLSNQPKILFYDIETTLAKSYHRGYRDWETDRKSVV